MGFEQDFDRIEEIVRQTDPSFGAVSGERMAAALADLRVASRQPDSGPFLLAAMRLLALPGNGHTRLVPNEAVRTLPFRFVAIGHDVHLTQAPDACRSHLDTIVEAVNGTPIDAVMARAAPYLAGTVQRRRVIGCLLLAWPEALAAMGAAGDGKTTEYTLRDEGGDARRLRLSNVTDVSASFLYPVGEHGRLNLVDDRPLVSVYTLTGGVLYLGLHSFFDPGETLDSGIATACAQVRQAAGKRIVCDLRGNTGGNFIRALPLADALAETATGPCVCLVDKFTFSAAIVFAALLKVRLGDRVTLLGEEMGDGLRFHAEGDTLLLPDSGAAVRYSTAYHDWQTGLADATTPSEIALHLVAVGSADPSPLAMTTAPDLRSGHDTCLDAALALFPGA